MCNSRDPQWGRALVERGAESLCDRLCDQIAHGPVRERVRALSIVRCLGLVSKIKDSVLRLTGDADATVRSLAVAMLGDLPGEASERVLCAAVDDPDARVQANAVEALDKLDVPNRLQCTQTKLTSPHGRVRANAIKSLLRLDMRRAAGELLRMLEDGSCSQRVSALWVVQRLELRSVLQRVVSLSRHDPDDRVKQRARRVLQELEGHTPPQGSSGLPTASSKPPQRMQGTWK